MYIPLQAIPYVRLLKRLLSGSGTLQSASYQQDILCPEEEGTNQPAIFLSQQLDRVKSSLPESTKEAEISAAISTRATHAATIAYHVKNAILLDGSIYTGPYRSVIADRSKSAPREHETRHWADGALASSYVGTKYFGHWLRDDCVQFVLAEEISRPLCLRIPFTALDHVEKYQGYLGQDRTPVDRARIDHLIAFQDFGQNSHKRRRYRTLRDRIKARFPGNARELFVYLRRGPTGAPRLIQNEEELLNTLVKRGFVVADIASDSLEEIIGMLKDAKIVVSLEGSQISHCTYTVPEDSGLLVLQPPDRFSAGHRGWAECLGVRFGFVVGTMGESGYCFSASEILDTTDLMLRSMDA